MTSTADSDGPSHGPLLPVETTATYRLDVNLTFQDSGLYTKPGGGNTHKSKNSQSKSLDTLQVKFKTIYWYLLPFRKLPACLSKWQQPSFKMRSSSGAPLIVHAEIRQIARTFLFHDYRTLSITRNFFTSPKSRLKLGTQNQILTFYFCPDILSIHHSGMLSISPLVGLTIHFLK